MLNEGHGEGFSLLDIFQCGNKLPTKNPKSIARVAIAVQSNDMEKPLPNDNRNVDSEIFLVSTKQ